MIQVWVKTGLMASNVISILFISLYNFLCSIRCAWCVTEEPKAGGRGEEGETDGPNSIMDEVW